MKSQFMRLNSQMRQGEITLQKMRINKKLKNKKAVALDVLKMLSEIDGEAQNGGKAGAASASFNDRKIGGDSKTPTTDKGLQTQSSEHPEELRLR